MIENASEAWQRFSLSSPSTSLAMEDLLQAFQKELAASDICRAISLELAA